MPLSPSPATPDKRRVARSFGAAAEGYDKLAALQREVGHRLLAGLPEYPSATILDLGAGTGYFTRVLRERYPASRVLALDLAEGMARRARERLGPTGLCLCGDAEALPLAERSVDLVFSNLALQWCAGLVGVFRELRRVLKPGGQVFFTTFGGATLAELRRAWAAADAHTHVHEFMEPPAIAAALAEAGFAETRLERETLCLEYADVQALMRELKGLGARNSTQGRPRHLTGRGALRRMLEAYPARTDSGIQASFELVYGYGSFSK